MQVGDRVKVIRQNGFRNMHGVIGTGNFVDEAGQVWDFGVLVGNRTWYIGFMAVELAEVNVTVLEGTVAYNKDGVPAMMTTDGEAVWPLDGYGGKRIRLTIEEIG